MPGMPRPYGYNSAMQHSGMTLEDIQNLLHAEAEKRFGKARAVELRTDLDQTAAELMKIVHHPMGFENEP